MLTPGQKKKLDDARNALEAVRGELSVLSDALSELQACADSADPDTSLADLDGEADATGLETELYYLEEKLEKFERAFRHYSRDQDEAELDHKHDDELRNGGCQ